MFKKWLEKRNSGGSSEDNESEDPLEEEYQNPLERMDKMDDEFKDTRGTDEAKTTLDDDGYTKFEFPWNLSLNYSFRLINGDFDNASLFSMNGIKLISTSGSEIPLNYSQGLYILKIEKEGASITKKLILKRFE